MAQGAPGGVAAREVDQQGRRPPVVAGLGEARGGRLPVAGGGPRLQRRREPAGHRRAVGREEGREHRVAGQGVAPREASVGGGEQARGHRRPQRREHPGLVDAGGRGEQPVVGVAGGDGRGVDHRAGPVGQGPQPSGDEPRPARGHGAGAGVEQLLDEEGQALGAGEELPEIARRVRPGAREGGHAVGVEPVAARGR